MGLGLYLVKSAPDIPHFMASEAQESPQTTSTVEHVARRCSERATRDDAIECGAGRGGAGRSGSHGHPDGRVLVTHFPSLHVLTALCTEARLTVVSATIPIA